MEGLAKRRVPVHIGLIPDRNRRWAVDKGLQKQEGYANGIAPGLALLATCRSASAFCQSKLTGLITDFLICMKR